MKFARAATVEVGLGSLLASILLVPALMPVAAAPGDGAQTVAFTDDRDELVRLEVVRESPGGPTSFEAIVAAGSAQPFGAETRHEGEASGSWTEFTDTPFVSTRQAGVSAGAATPDDVDPDGEVYIDLEDTRGSLDLPDPLPVTCNEAVESHPVLSPSSGFELWRVAFAADIDGDWDIYVATSSLPGATSEMGCEDWEIQNITDPDGTDSSDEVWPAWTPDGHVVFSRTLAPGPGDDAVPLSDLHVSSVSQDGSVGETHQLTATPSIAETQANASEIFFENQEGTSHWVAFTTTQFRPDGSIAFLQFDESRLGEDLPEITPAFDSGRQGGEPVWSGSAFDPYLAYTSTDRDPYGDIHVASIVRPMAEEESSGGPIPAEPPRASFSYPVAEEPGVAESHAAWTDEFDEGSEDDQAQLTYTRRSVEADISEARDDGTGRRSLVQRLIEDDKGGVFFRYDESGPNYSPDGERFAFSNDFDGEFVFDFGRQLMVGDAETDDPANNARPLMDLDDNAEGPTRDQHDFDTDPVWSPNGREVAFVRYAWNDGYGPPEIMVYNVDDGSLRQISQQPDNDNTFHDTDPSWSPDGRQLVISRQVESPPQVSLVAQPTPLPFSPHRLQILSAATANSGVTVAFPVASNCPPTQGCSPTPVRGRSPAWSPDGTKIVFDDRGALQTVSLDPSGPGANVWLVNGFQAVTGFLGGRQQQDAEPTESRRSISAADDPAWSPDGREIAFAGQPAGQPDQRGIYAIRPDGSGLRLITDGRGPETEPAYRGGQADLSVTMTVSGAPASVGAPVTVTMTVTNRGPADARDVVLQTSFSAGGTAVASGAPPGCAADGSGCTLPNVAAGESVSYVVQLTYPAPVDGTATASVTSGTTDPAPGNNEATGEFVVSATQSDIGVTIQLDEPVGYVGGTRLATFIVTNDGPEDAAGVTLTTSYPEMVTPDPASTPTCITGAEPCPIGTIAAGDELVFEVVLMADAEGAGPIEAEVTTPTPDLVLTNNTAEVQLPVLQPTIRLLPSVARPGQVTMAYGENMPPGSEVQLRWNKGITVDSRPVPVQDDGTVRMPILIVRKDQLGTRTLEAQSVEDLFSPVEGDMLVVPRLMAAPDFVARG